MDPDDRDAIATLSAEIRRTIEATPVPGNVAATISRAVARFGEHAAYAVRSSATAEDLPTASFAGQQDTYLNVIGATAVLDHVRRCWASLYTERAVTYRVRNGVDHRTVEMAVVVQQMVFPDAAGVLFTADPVTSNRKVAFVEATIGLGEALVSGRVNADVSTVRDGEIVTAAIATKQLAIHAAPAGGTQEHEIEPARQAQPALTDAQVVRLADLGRRIEAHFGSPQDIEWCLVDDDFQFVQSRPITTLFPIPEVGDDDNHVFVSVGHQQMMTDPMKPLGLSMFQLIAFRPMYEAAGRLFVDVADALASPASRASLLALWRSDPLVGDALQTIVDRNDFVPTREDDGAATPPFAGTPTPIDADPAIVTELMEGTQESIAALQRDIQGKSGPALLDFILADIPEMKRILFDPRSHQVFMTAMEATWWLNERLYEWLGEKNAADTLTLSVPHNVTSEMGLALLDVADVIRPHPDVVAFLQEVDDEGFLDELPRFEGGQDARDAIEAYLDTYGMRCVGEIDITRPRWQRTPHDARADDPRQRQELRAGRWRTAVCSRATRGVEQGAGAAGAGARPARRDAQGRRGQADDRSRADVHRVPGVPEVRQGLPRVRVQAGLARGGRAPRGGGRAPCGRRHLLPHVPRAARRRAHGTGRRSAHPRTQGRVPVVPPLTPPRVMTSDGEVVTGAYRRDDAPSGTLIGLPVSAGTVEGRARVIVDMAGAELDTGDILVTPFTDPSWSPLFVTVAGLVTEVGGLMTHGAVIAREYGLPAVVGVEHATQLIRDGQRIRVNGTDGYIEILADP